MNWLHIYEGWFTFLRSLLCKLIEKSPVRNWLYLIGAWPVLQIVGIGLKRDHILLISSNRRHPVENCITNWLAQRIKRGGKNRENENGKKLHIRKFPGRAREQKVIVRLRRGNTVFDWYLGEGIFRVRLGHRARDVTSSYELSDRLGPEMNTWASGFCRRKPCSVA